MVKRLINNEIFWLLISSTIVVFFVLYMTYSLNFTASTSFWEVLRYSLDLSKAKYPLSRYFSLLLNSTILVSSCLFISFFLGFWFSKYDALQKVFGVLAAVPELLLLALFRATIWTDLVRSESQLLRGTIIALPIVIRSTAAMYGYFHLSREKYSQTYFYHLAIMREMPRLKRLKYLMRSTFLDAMSNLIFEFPILVSYVAIFERIFEFRGLSREFLGALIYGNPYELLRYAILLLAMLAVFQTIFITMVRLADRR